MVRKRYVWFINRKKPKRKKRKYKTQKSKGFGDPFKLLYSIGKQWRNNLRWDQKNYAMIKLNVPKKVTLPNGRTFVVRYKRIPRDQLRPNIVMRKLTLEGLRLGVEDEDSEDVEFWILSKKVARNPLVKSIARKDLEYAPGVYWNLTKRVKNKILKRILDSDAAHSVLNNAISTANNRLGWARD